MVGTGLSGALFGIAVAAFVAEVVFHQLLHWHKFYDRSTTEVGLVSDGLFHAFSFFAAVASLFLLAELRRRGELVWQRWLGAVLVGAGAFQLYDGTIQHKLMGLHQIRYEVDLLPYVDFDVAAWVDGARRARPGVEVLEVSATRGDGMTEWYAWLRDRARGGRDAP